MIMSKWTILKFDNPPLKKKISTTQQPKVRLASKFERQVDRRTFVDKKGLYDGVSVDATYHVSLSSLLQSSVAHSRVESIQTIRVSDSKFFIFSDA